MLCWAIRRCAPPGSCRQISQTTRTARANYSAGPVRGAAVEGAKGKYAIGTEIKEKRNANVDSASNPLEELVRSYRVFQTPIAVRFKNGPANTTKLKAKKALEHEGKDVLNKQRKARIGLRLYDTLTAQQLAEMFPALNNLDIRHELPAQEHDTIAQAQELAKNDSSWELHTQTRHSQSGRKEVNAALGKRLHKVYRFDSWTLATKHFWKRINEYFEQQDHHAEINVRFNPDTKLTEVRIDMNTHTPKELPQTEAVIDGSPAIQEKATQAPGDQNVADQPSPSSTKRKIAYGPSALTRKDFILAWSLDVAAFRTRQKQSLLERRAAKRAAKKNESESGIHGAGSSISRDASEVGLNATTGADQTATATESTTEANQDTEAERTVASTAILPDIPVPSNESGATTPAFVDPARTPTDSKTPATQRNLHTSAASLTASAKRPKRSIGSDGLSLQHFLTRTQILAEYRKAVRATKTLPDSHTRRETLNWLRQDLEPLRQVSDLAIIKETLSRFRRDSKQFIPSIGLSTGTDGEQVVAKLIGRS